MTNSRPKLVAIDLDGTLLNSERKISPENKNAVIRAKSFGIEIVLASGRLYRNLRQFQLQLGIEDNPSIASNGAEVHGRHNKILHKAFLETTVKKVVLSLAEKYSLHVNAYTHDELLFLADDDWGNTYLSRVHPTQRRLTSLEEVMTGQVVKILLIGNPDELAHFHQAEKSFLNSYNVKITESEPEYLEFLPSSTSKATGLLAICDAYSIPINDTCAIGDYLNDLEMLEIAGLPIAMQNSHPSVQAIAKLVTDSNDNHGVAKAIHQICDSLN